MRKTEKILVIKLGALGDFIQALGPMAAIRKHHSEADIALLTTEPFISLGRNCGYFDHIWTDDRPRWHNIKGWIELANRLNKAGFDRVYDLQNNDRTGFYFKLFRKKPEWVGTVKGASHHNNSPERTAGHTFDGHVQTLKLAGIDHVGIDDLSWMKGDIAHFNIESPYVLLVPGCSPGRPEKRWGAENYGVLARTLYGWGYLPVIIGTAGESELGTTISQFCPQGLDLTGKTALSDIVLLARQAEAAIGNDTGPMHIIAATACPSYVLFSKYSNPVKHAPKGTHVQVIRNDNLDDLAPEELISKISVRDFRSYTQETGTSSGEYMS